MTNKGEAIDKTNIKNRLIKLLFHVNYWFEKKIGWFFVNGRKQEDFAGYLKINRKIH